MTTRQQRRSTHGGAPERISPKLGTAFALALPLMGAAPALAHHAADASGLQPTLLNGLLSGLAHPVVGPDHLVFLLALSLIGLQRRLRWSLALLAVGLLGGAAGLAWPGLPGSETLLPLTLVLEALVLLGQWPALVLIPAMALHGYALSAPVFGWSTTPLLGYSGGLLVSQGLLLVVSLALLKPVAARLKATQLRWAALALMAGGGSWALASLAA